VSDLSITSAQYGLSGAAAAAIGGLPGLPPAQSPPVGLAGRPDSGSGPAAAAQISKQGQLFSQLQQLQSSDPDKYKQLLTDAANKLSSAAQSATGGDQQFLSNLAAKFSKAADGDLSALEPPQRSSGTAVGAAYQQGAQTTLSGAPLTALAQNAGSSASGQQDPSQSGAQGASGGHHHHHHHGGGHSKLGAGTQQTLQSVFQSLDSALGGASSSSASTSSDPATAATAVAAGS